MAQLRCSLKQKSKRVVLSVLIVMFWMVDTVRAQATLETEINRAIRRGRDILRSQLQPLDVKRESWAMGKIGLCLAALLKAGVPSDDEVVRDGFQKLEGLPLDATYSVSCYLFALDAYWNRQVEESQPQKTIVGPGNTRIARGKVRRKMVELANWLVSSRVSGEGTWGYHSFGLGPKSEARGYDHSNTQFAVLGLEIASRHKISIPTEVFLEIGKHFLRTQRQKRGGTVQLKLTMDSTIAETFGVSSTTTTASFDGNRTQRPYPAGWAYTDGGRLTESMTAAGASSLLVVREAMRRTGKLNRGYEKRLNDSIYASVAWMATRLSRYFSGSDRPYYYTLYSLEKVGDLGRIRTINGSDWYRRGAEVLLERRQRDGSWGVREDTAFALLFLTRATRPALETLPAPTIYTSTDGFGGSSDIKDLVYVDAIEGFISAGQFFRFLTQMPDRRLVPIAQQVVRNYALHRQGELVPGLLSLRTCGSSAVETFSRKALGDVTGVHGEKLEFYVDWYKQYRQVVSITKTEDSDPEAVGHLLRQLTGLSLKNRLLDFVESQALGEASGFLVQELLVDDEGYRQRVHGILHRFTAQPFPAPQEGHRRAEWAQVATTWRRWWEANGASVVASFRTRRLVARLNGDKLGAEARKQLLAQVVQEGERAVPALLEKLKEEKYRFDLVLALEAISGESHGVLANEWRTWWDATKRD